MEKAELLARVASYPYWYHRIALPGGVVTPGWAPLRAEAYGVPPSLAGQRVLDIGAWDGYWTFEALRRGAREAVAIDDFSDLLDRLQDGDRRAWGTFDLCREALGYSPEVCRRYEMSTYDLREETLGRFDTVFFFGTFYHLKHPLLALEKIAAVCDGTLYVESAILDFFSPYRGVGQGYPGEQMVVEFYPGKEYGNNAGNWWVPTLHCLKALVESVGFQGVRAWKLTETPPSLTYCRGFVSGRKA
jgi:tRNA (mo5U34)-methyltransferase